MGGSAERSGNMGWSWSRQGGFLEEGPGNGSEGQVGTGVGAEAEGRAGWGEDGPGEDQQRDPAPSLAHVCHHL